MLGNIVDITQPEDQHYQLATQARVVGFARIPSAQGILANPITLIFPARSAQGILANPITAQPVEDLAAFKGQFDKSSERFAHAEENEEIMKAISVKPS
jgi:hypothetical protein